MPVLCGASATYLDLNIYVLLGVDKTVTWSLKTLRTVRIDQRRTVNNVSYKINDRTYETKKIVLFK